MEITTNSDKNQIIRFLILKSSQLGRTVLKNEVLPDERRIIVKAFGSWSNAIKVSQLELADSSSQTKLRMAQYKEIKARKARETREENTIWEKTKKQ